nr:hypothetical protein [Streptomyces caniscabiei]
MTFTTPSLTLNFKSARLTEQRQPTEVPIPKLTRTIEIDDEVFACLQRLSEPLVDTPNDVLRRVLLKGGAAAAASADPAGTRRAGSLKPLIEAGLVAAGDKVRHHQSRLKRTHEAVITTDGWIEIPDGQAFPRPSPALKAQTGNEINGWGQYIHVPSGRRLQELREEAAG